jgi:hypothetical protein
MLSKNLSKGEYNVKDPGKIYLSHIESQQVNLHTYEAMIDREVFDL